MRRLLPILLLAAAAPAHAGELSVGAGAVVAHRGADPAVLLELAHFRDLGPHSDLVFRAECLLDTEGFDGNPIEYSSWGLDVGLRRHVTTAGALALHAAASLGLRIHATPDTAGIGPVARATLSASLPIGSRFHLALAISGEAGPVRIGDEDPNWELQRRADAIAALSAPF